MAKKYLIETFGCQMNFHDSERMQGLLEEAGYELTDDDTEADVLVINTCSVRERAQEKLFSRLGRVEKNRTDSKEERPIVVVAGCVAQQEGSRLVQRAPIVDIVIGTQATKRLPVLIEQANLNWQTQIDVELYEDVSFPFGLVKRNDPVKAYVTIIEGCNDFCSFCVVPYTRGRERMRPVREILAEIKEATETGRKEIHLLGQIVNHYQAPDVEMCNFSKLLELVHEIDGVERIRFSSPHPRHVTPDLISVIRDLPKICNHLHLPVQSGSNEVLTRMRRRYTRETYLDLIQRLREEVPGIGLSTDMIVGFPGENEKNFDETLSLTNAAQYQSMFSFKYSQRPNTLAAKKMNDDVPEAEKTRRITTLQMQQRKIQSSLNEEMLGASVSVLVDSKSRRNPEELSGRTETNTVVNLPGKPNWIGRTLTVKVERSGPNSLWGQVVD